MKRSAGGVISLVSSTLINSVAAVPGQVTTDLDEGAPRTHSQRAGVRCCTGDEGGPLGAGLQELAPNPLKLQRSKAGVVSVEEKAGLRSCQGESQERSASERLRTCRKGLGDVKTGGSSLTRDQCGGYLFTAHMASGMKAA